MKGEACASQSKTDPVSGEVRALLRVPCCAPAAISSWRALATHPDTLPRGFSNALHCAVAMSGSCRASQSDASRRATSHDEELARQGAPLQLPGQATGLELGHHQRQDGHIGPVLGHQAGCAPSASIADDQASLRMAASGINQRAAARRSLLQQGSQCLTMALRTELGCQPNHALHVHMADDAPSLCNISTRLTTKALSMC